jgi:hypothetical protein
MKIIHRARTEIKYDTHFGEPCCEEFNRRSMHFYIAPPLAVYIRVEDIETLSRTCSYGINHMMSMHITHCPFCGQKFEFVEE